MCSKKRKPATWESIYSSLLQPAGASLHYMLLRDGGGGTSHLSTLHPQLRPKDSAITKTLEVWSGAKSLGKGKCFKIH